MEIALIACSKTKKPGGTYQYHGSLLEQSLKPDSYKKLLEKRCKLARLISQPSGPDLGEMSPGSQVLQFMPAFQRYQGRVYERGMVESLYPHAEGIQLVIVSALYGLVDGKDLIRNYELEMAASVPRIGLLKNWWRQQGLGNFVIEYIFALKPTRVHDLLSNHYRDALGPETKTAVQAFGIEWISHEYPGEGSGSMWKRGDDLKRLLTKQPMNALSTPASHPPLEIPSTTPATPRKAPPTQSKPKGEAMGTQADQIREYVIKTYITPARAKGQSSVRIRSGDIAKELNLQNRMPSVCNALDGDKFLAQARITRISRSGPAHGATVEWVLGL